MSLKDYLVKEKPSLSQSSITTYHSILKSLYTKVFHSNELDLNKLKEETEKILDYLKDLPFKIILALFFYYLIRLKST